MKRNIILLIICIVITFLIGNLFAIFIDTSSYNRLNKIINLPGYIFPIVWSILYLIMGITLFLILKSNNELKYQAIRIYFIQLLVNSLWTLFFFKFNLYLFSYIWIILLIILVIIMIIKFYKIKIITGILNIFYLLWLIFASILNLGIVILN